MNQGKFYYDWKEFEKAFKRLGKFCAVLDWTWGCDYPVIDENPYKVIVVFANSRKVRFACKSIKEFDGIYKLIEVNKLKHNTNESI